MKRGSVCKVRGCPICEDPTSGASTYREYDTKYRSPEYLAWEEWFKAHNFPIAQVPLKGWAARDIVRNTESAKVMDWNPGDEDNPKFGEHTLAYVDRTDDGHFNASKDVRFAVYTVQLESEPLPFPVMASVEVS